MMQNASFNQNQMCEREFKPTETKPYEIVIGDNIINMISEPHLLISGSVCSGKSKLMEQLIINQIINSKNEMIDLYLMQMCKSDMCIFDDCKPVKYYADDIYKCERVLTHIEKEIKERQLLINNLVKEGLGDSILDYNKIAENKMKYIYIFIDEYAEILEFNYDDKEKRELKKKSVDIINKILQVGRQVGCFVIIGAIAYQNLFNNNLMLALVSNKLIMRINNSITSRRLIDTSESLNLKEREGILLRSCKGINQKMKVDYIDTKNTIKYISNFREKDHKFIDLPVVKIAKGKY